MPLDGTQQLVKLSPPLPPGARIHHDIRLTPDGGRVLIFADTETVGVPELYGVPLAGGAAAERLNGPIPPGGGFELPTLERGVLALAEGRVAFQLDGEVAGRVELYLARADGSGEAVKVNGPLLGGVSDELPCAFAGPVAIHGPRPTRMPAALRGLVGIGRSWSSAVPLGSGPALRLQISPDGSRVVFERASGTGVEIHSVPRDASAPPVRIDDSPAPIRPPVVLGTLFRFTSDGARIVYADDLGHPSDALYSVPTVGGEARVPLNDFVPAGARYQGYEFTSDGSRVVFRAEVLETDAFELFTVPLAGGPSAKLNERLPYEVVGSVGAAEFSPDGDWIVYRANQEGDGIELFGINFDAFHQLNPVLTPGQAVDAFRISPDGARVAYFVRGGSADELYSVPIDAHAAPVRLNGDLVPFGSLDEFAFSPDGTRVVYRAAQDSQSSTSLYSVPADRSAPPVRISGAPVPFEDVTRFRFAPDGTRVVYAADQDVDGTEDVYVAPVLGGAAPLRLSSGHAAGTTIRDLEIASDSARAVYRTLSGVNLYSLRSAPLDGSQPAVELNAPLPSNRSVQEYALTADGRHVLYRANQDNTFFELYVVPIDRSTPPRRVHSQPAKVDAFLLSGDGLRVVYSVRANQGLSSDLFAALTDGSVPPRQLNPTPPQLVRHEPLALTPSADRVLYGSDGELYSIPFDGGTPLHLSAGHPGLITASALSPLGNWVGFVTFGQTADERGLFSVPVDGGQPAHPESRLLRFGGISEFRFAPNERAMTYRARQDTPATELYLSFLLSRPEGGHSAADAPSRSTTVIR